MNFEEIKKQVEYLEDRVITNFAKYFSYLVLEDFYEGGYTDRIEDEFFYEEYFSRYEDEIINLLLSIGDEFDGEYPDLKLRLIKMKRVIDNHLSKISNDIENNSYRHNRTSNFLLSQKLDKEKFIDFLYNQLINNKLINASLKDFKNHFETEWNNKIQWLGTELQLVNLITLFIENEYLDSETVRFKNKLIASHFINKKGNPFIEKQLGSVFSDKKDSMFNDVTNTIMDEISTNF